MLAADALFWYAESATPEIRPLVGALLLLEHTPRRPLLRDAVERLVRQAPRLRQRVSPHRRGVGFPQWEAHRQFEMDYHLRDLSLPQPASERHLLDFIAAVFAGPLDHMRPLWEAYLIEGLEDGRAAFFFKAHHSIVDGVGALALLEALTGPNRRASYTSGPQRPEPARGSPARRADGRTGDTPVWSAATVVGGAAARAVRDPWSAVDNLSRLMRTVNGVFGDLQATRPITDPLARDSEGIGRHLELVAFPLRRMRRAKEILNVSLNDVMLMVVAGALGRYHDQLGKHVDALHCMVPMSLRRDDERDDLGNRVGVFNVTLPIGERSVLLRLAQIHAQTQRAKRDRRGTAYPFLMGIASLLPRGVFRALTQQAVGRFHLICTNIPGPASGRFLAGARVEAIYPFAPLLMGAPLSVALLSYRGNYAIGIDADPVALPQPELLAPCLREAADELCSLASNHGRGAARRTKRRGPKSVSTSTRPRPRASA